MNLLGLQEAELFTKCSIDLVARVVVENNFATLSTLRKFQIRNLDVVRSPFVLDRRPVRRRGSIDFLFIATTAPPGERSIFGAF